MIQQIRKIGNSSGIIIPKSMLDNCKISDTVELEVVRDMIVIKPIKKKRRENWDLLFKEANKKNQTIEEDLFNGITSEFDKNEW
ncbi:MAG TPA: AbrB/MazE/SpoVT family DNA-binding domain-containing protein [Saprospiraceae bacterium]|nr:AbrB/MazE/SpoVT family DNA-binding domain-containing protein [Saprospiraceae bacterium]HMU05762.1 AbrB/MazE/SpoVT family DNA-binding domain-containing protein [Saprospiraceae bacterium]